MEEHSTKTSRRPQHFQFATRDVDEYMGILSRLHAPVKAASPRANSFAIECSSVMSEGICMSRARCESGVALEFDSTFDGYGLSLLNAGSFEVAFSGGRVLQTTLGGGLMVDSRETVRASMGAETRLPRIAVSSEELHARLSGMIDGPVLRRIQFSERVPLGSRVAELARTLTDIIYDGVQASGPLLTYPAALASLRDAVLNLMLEGMPHSYADRIQGRAPLPSPRSVRRAMDFMSTYAAQPIRLADIARAAGVSERSLQSGFVRFRGMTPMQFLRSTRLNGARAALLLAVPGTTISATAYAWGFPHLSSFSTRYLAAFGEHPSTTLRRAVKGSLDGSC